MENNSNIQYEALKQRINEIITNFSFEYDTLNPPTDEQEDMIRAMVVLCHAEFEDYIENLANSLLLEGETKWDTEGIANKNVAALFLHAESFKQSDKQPLMTMKTYSRKQFADYRNSVLNGNHGIKRKNMENMYTPLGYSLDEFNQDFLNELEAFGGERGKVAHSASSKTRRMLNVDDEKGKIYRILNELKEFEEQLHK